MQTEDTDLLCTLQDVFMQKLQPCEGSDTCFVLHSTATSVSATLLG